MPTRVLILDNAVHRRLFRPPWHWKAHLKGTPTDVVNVPSSRPIPSLANYTHLILTGSEASILNSSPWYEKEADVIRSAVERGLPILGSCFGHQMLVYALSGPQFLASARPPEVGWADIEMLEADPLFAGVPNPWRTFVYHFDEVVNPPPPWRILGRSRSSEAHVIRFGDHQVWGIQAHPEISSEKAKAILRLTLLFGRKPARHIFHALRNVPPRNHVASSVVKRFLETVPSSW